MNNYTDAVRMFFSWSLDLEKLVANLVRKWKVLTAQMQEELIVAAEAAFQRRKRQRQRSKSASSSHYPCGPDLKYWKSARDLLAFGSWLPKEGDETDPLTVMEARENRLIQDGGRELAGMQGTESVGTQQRGVDYSPTKNFALNNLNYFYMMMCQVPNG